MTFKPQLFVTLVGVLFLTLSCADPGPARSLDDAPQAREAAERSKDFDGYVLYFNAMTTDKISQEDAAKYGITRSKSRAMLNVVIRKKVPGQTTAPISGKVSAKTNNLTGQLKNIALKQIDEGDSIYYIGDVAIANNETLQFEIEATPEDSDESLVANFSQQFFTN